MMYELPDEWYEEHDGQRLVLNQEVVLAVVSRMQAALEEIAERCRVDPEENRQIALRGLDKPSQITPNQVGS